MVKPVPYNTTVQVELTIEQLAYAIAHLDSSEQACLISQIAKITQGPGFREAMQLQYITDDPLLTKEGRRLMGRIGNYAWPLPE